MIPLKHLYFLILCTCDEILDAARARYECVSESDKASPKNQLSLQRRQSPKQRSRTSDGGKWQHRMNHTPQLSRITDAQVWKGPDRDCVFLWGQEVIMG